MATASHVSELLEQERRFWNAMKEKDAAAAEQMTDDGCVVVGAQGVSAIDGATMAQLTEQGEWDLQEYEFDEEKTQIRLVGKDVAIVAYPVSERVTVSGETIALDANDASVWVRSDGRWRCALHTESLAGDPFGRDRSGDG